MSKGPEQLKFEAWHAKHRPLDTKIMPARYGLPKEDYYRELNAFNEGEKTLLFFVEPCEAGGR